jgi:hypothetical protein
LVRLFERSDFSQSDFWPDTFSAKNVKRFDMGGAAVVDRNLGIRIQQPIFKK